LIKFVIFLLLCLIFPLNYAHGAHWHKVPVSLNKEFTGLHFVDENNGFLVTKRGLIVSIEFSDTTVTMDTISVEADLYDICFMPDGRNGFAVGSKGARYKTGNSGRTWEETRHHPDMRFTQAAFVDSTKGFLVGTSFSKKSTDAGFIMRTSDGGATWDSLAVNGRKIREIDISPENLVTVLGFGAVFISEDLGNSWATAKLNSGKLPMAAAIRGDHGIIIGGRGLLALSSDRGRNWEFFETLSETASFFDILMLDSKRAYIVGTGGEVLYTKDAGYNWIPEASTTGNDLNAIEKIGRRIIACGKKGTLIYTDIEN